MEKKSEVSEQNLTEGKVIHYLCSIEQCVNWVSWLAISKHEAK